MDHTEEPMGLGSARAWEWVRTALALAYTEGTRDGLIEGKEVVETVFDNLRKTLA
jgi:hypothetical protein